MTLHSRPASPDAVSNVETDHPHILLPTLFATLTCNDRILPATGTPAYSLNTGRANCIPDCVGDLRAGDSGSTRTRAPPRRKVSAYDSEVLLGLHCPFGLALVLRFAQRLALVPFALASGQGDLDLDPRSLEVEFERDEGAP